MAKKKVNVGLFSSEPLKENIEKDLSQETTKQPDPTAEKIQEEPPVKSSLQKLRDTGPIDYTTMKIKRELHTELKKIAKKEKIKHAGNLLEHIVSEWITKYNEV